MKKTKKIIKSVLLILFLFLFFSNNIKAQGTTCASATLITVNGACNSGLINDATITAGFAPSCTGAIIRREGWYRFVATSTNATITVITPAGATNEPGIQVFSGACAGLAEIGCAQADLYTTTGQIESVGFSSGLTIGTTYYFRVMNFANSDFTPTSVCVTNALNNTIASCSQIAGLSGNVISLYDPSLPISGTNPVNTIPLTNSTFKGLTLCPNINGGTTSPTYYTINSTTMTYWWWNAVTNTWINTGHTAGPTAAYTNPGGGGGYIYNLNGSTGDVYRYNGTGNATFWMTIPGFTAFAGPIDLNVDTDGNIYIFNTDVPQQIRVFTPTGSLLCSGTLTLAPVTAGGAGFAVIGGNVYTSTAQGYFVSPLSTNMTFVASANPFNWHVVNDYASCQTAPLCGVLPIELLSFNGDCINENTIKLEWSTASEINNDFFTIEGSKNGKDFDVLSTIDGAGNSNQVLNYKWTDESPLHGINFYRLKQTDYDGKFEYFGPIQIKSDCGENTPAELTLLNNPVENNLGFQYSTLSEENINISVYDVCGKLVYHEPTIASEGNNLFTVDVNTIAKGFYFLKVGNKNGGLQKKFIKQ
ncbi:MAG: T9SS type A sorting domain-containing protein [Bacteroidetes bacterium]|nr:T9SS type A sorting domain-containing protein [Bacteroidota bacterium]